MQQILEIFQQFRKYIKKYPRYWFYFFLRLLTTSINISIPLFVGYIIVLITNHNALSKIIPVVAVLFVLLIINPFMDKVATFNGWALSARIAYDFRYDAVKKLKYVGLSFWQKYDQGNVIKIIDLAYEHFFYMAGNVINAYMPFLGKIIGIVLSTTFIDPFVGLLIFLDILLVLFSMRMILPSESEAGIKERKSNESVVGRIFEYVINYKTVVYLDLFQRQNKEISEFNEVAYATYKKREALSSLKWYFNTQTHSFFVGIILIYSLYQVFHGHLQVGLLTTIIFFCINISDTLNQGVWTISELLKYSNSMRRYKDTFGEVKDIEDTTKPIRLDFSSLELKNISLLQQDRETLQNINLKIDKGEKVAIVGFTGSGKTTLIDILLKAILHYDGNIYINDFNYNDLQVHDIAKVFSIVPQDVQLFQGSVKGNITIHTDYEEKDLQKVLHVAELESLVAKLPKGVESHIHEHSSNISGGEKQRIGIARALLQNHPVLILDEATASLDPKTERQVITNLIQEYPHTTLLYITHKYSLLNLFDTIVVLNEGKMIERGSFDTLMKKGGLFKDLFEASILQ